MNTSSENQDGGAKPTGEAPLAAAPGSANWLCPFCKRECVVGWDCECGAKALNSAMWFTEKPIMRAACLGEMGLVLAATSKTLGQSLREMLPSPNDERLALHTPATASRTTQAEARRDNH